MKTQLGLLDEVSFMLERIDELITVWTDPDFKQTEASTKSRNVSPIPCSAASHLVALCACRGRPPQSHPA